MSFKIGSYYKLKIEPANFLVDRYIDENYAVVDFVDSQAFRLSQITMFEDINGKFVKYLGIPLAGSAKEVLICVETKFGNVNMIMDESNLIPLTATAKIKYASICVCALEVLMTAGCQCGCFQKEQSNKLDAIIKS